MISGKYDFSLDAKNRIFVPAKLREDLGEQIVMVKGIDRCISVYPLSGWESFCAKLEALPKTEIRHVKRFLYASAMECKIDGQGRVIIPTPLRDYANIEKYVIIIGVGDHAEIWSQAGWISEEEKADTQSMEDMLIKLGF